MDSPVMVTASLFWALPLLASLAVWLWPRPVRVDRRVRTRARPSPVLVAELAGVLLVAVLGVVARSPTLVVLGLLAIGATRIACVRRRRRQAAASLDDALVELADGLGQQLRSGGVLAPAFRALVEAEPRLAEPFGEVASAVAVGARLDTELREVARREHRAGVRLVSVALSVLVRRGGSAVPALERLGQSLRDHRAGARERALQSSQARASAAVLAVLPVVFVVVAASVDAEVRAFYLHRLAGLLCLTAMLVLAGTCWLWIDRLTEDRP